MGPRLRITGALLVMLVAHGCATASLQTSAPESIRGIASWYGEEFAGRVTASGEIFDPLQLTAAHRALPFGTIAVVTNMETGATVQVRINDRGPFVGNRIIDLSYAAARQIGLIEQGIGNVDVMVIKLGDGRRGAPPPDPVAAEVASDQPPVVPFPLPPEAGTHITVAPTADEDEFEVEVVEERGGVPMRKRVSADGRDLESVPADGSSPAPQPSVAPPQPPVTLQTPVYEEKYFLQLGAFQNENNAETLRKKAAKIVRTVFIEESLGLFRVRAGPFPTRDRALTVQETFRKADLPSLLLTE